MITKNISVPIEGRCLLFETASLSVLGCDHDVTEPRIPVCSGGGTATAGAR